MPCDPLSRILRVSNVTMSWGTELWDKYDDLCRHLFQGIEFVEASMGGFVKERAKIEKEYAEKLRGLVKKYAIKEHHKNGNPSEDFTHVRAYKQMLNEVGFQAGQHEVLAEALAKDRYKSIHENVKKMRDRRKKNMKEADKLHSDLKQTYKNLDNVKLKFRKAFEEYEKASSTYETAEADGSVARNEVEKLRLAANMRSQNCDTYKGQYASQLIKTNEYQCKYYTELLPNVINGLQDLEGDRIHLLKDSIDSCVQAERDRFPIIVKCLDSIQEASSAINVEEDFISVIEQNKSGDIPPGDFKFEDMPTVQAMLSADVLEKPTNLNLYPKKRELEKRIEEVETELAKSTKELSSIETMVQTYKKNPKFGDVKKFQNETVALRQRITQLEQARQALHNEHTAVSTKLEELTSRSPMVPGGRRSPGLVRRDPRRGSESSGNSLKSSNPSIREYPSPDSTEPTDSLPDPDYEVPHGDAEWQEEEEPPAPRCIALYTFEGEQVQESNIPIREGEELEIVEGDCEGWTRVRRVDNAVYNDAGEGYVPTSFIQLL